MKLIFNQAHQVYIWLGEHDDRSKQLFEYAERKRIADNSSRRVLNRMLSRKELRDSIEQLLERPWFHRVWVLPEVVLAKHTRVVCGGTRISWYEFVSVCVSLRLKRISGYRSGHLVPSLGASVQRCRLTIC